MEFLRHVSANTPLLIKGGIRDWPALYKWNTSFFRKSIGNKVVSVSVTPNGYADAVAADPSGKRYFVEPEEREMLVSDFIDALLQPEAHPGVFYIQQQNSNLTTEFNELIPDIKEDIDFATEALNSLPVAVNLWVGDKRSVTSMHKDPFENLYCVIDGHKDFILYPPTDRPWIPYESFPMARYCETSPGKFEIIPEKKTTYVDPDATEEEISKTFTAEDMPNNIPASSVPWIAIDPLKPDLKSYPSYLNSSPMKVRVKAGDLLYLPSLWFHHVQQSHGAIAVNFWYDMIFDIKYVYYRFLESFLPPLQVADKTGLENVATDHDKPE